MNDNPTRHVLIALLLAAAILIVAGDRWSERITAFRPVRPVRKGE